MIIPTPEFDPLFAQDGVPFREKMNAYIAREFSDLLTPAGMAAEEAPRRGKPFTARTETHRPSVSPPSDHQRGRSAA